MLNKRISKDHVVATLSPRSALFYTWCIPHLDCEGRIEGSPEILKGVVVPYRQDFTLKVITSCIHEINSKKSLICYYGNTHKYIQFLGFDKNQKVNKDREAPSEVPAPTPDELQSKSRETLAKVKLSLSKVNNTMSGKPDFVEPIVYLNQKANRSFDPKNESNQNLVKARYNEGRTLEQFKIVIDKKVAQWHDNDKMMAYLRPSTLFNKTNFENYLNEPISQEVRHKALFEGAK